jgi:hypothetical protein
MLNKNVNGKTVEMSPAEEAEVRAGWDEASRPRTPQEQDDINDKKAGKLADFTPDLHFLLDEINILRVQAGLPSRTAQDVKDLIKAGL